MATAFSNIIKDSKLYQSNSSAQLNQVFNLSWGSNPVKFAYWGNTCIYDYRGQGYFIGIGYGTTAANPITFDEDWRDEESYLFCYIDAYNSIISNTTSNGKVLLSGISNYDGKTPGVDTANNVLIQGYFLTRNTQNYSYYTNSTTPAIHIPRIQHTYAIQNEVISNYDISNAYSSYTYLWRNNAVVGDKLAIKYFMPRRTYTCRYQIVTKYYGSAMYESSSTYNIYYNVNSEITFGTGIWGSIPNSNTGDKYKYAWNSSMSYSTNYSKAALDSYIYNVIFLNNGGNSDSKEYHIYSFDQGLKKCEYLYNSVHSNHNGDQYYYYGKDKTIQMYWGLDLNSYQHVNQYVTELIEPKIHDRIHMTSPKLKLQPYMLVQINNIGESTAAGNWADVRTMFFIHLKDTDEVYRLNYGVIGSSDYVNNYGLNQDWKEIIYNNLNWFDSSYYKYRNSRYPYSTIYRIFSEYNYEDGVTIGKNYYVSSSTAPYHIVENVPPIRNFPDQEMLNSLSQYPGNSYTSSTGRAWFRTQSAPTVVSSIDSSNFLTNYKYVEQYTPDIDGQNELTQDYVHYGCSYSYNYYDINGNISYTGIGSTTGNPYYYEDSEEIAKLPWEWHDKDVNIICVSYNANLTYGDVTFNTYYDINCTYDNFNATTPSTVIETINEYVHNVKIAAEVSYFPHNLTVNHNYNRSGFDSHNHFNFRCVQSISNF